MLKFELLHKDKNSKARAGKITTDHGVIETPIFMPVGTQGTVKAVTQRTLEEDIRAGLKLNITSTPTFVVGEEVYVGHIPPEIFESALED